MRKWFYHALFWIVLFLIWDRLFYFYVDNQANSVYFSLLDVSLVMAGFYLLYLWVMPDYLRRKNLARLLLQAVLIVGILGGLDALLMLLFLRHMLVPIHFNFTWNYSDLEYNRFFIAGAGGLGGCFVKLALDRLELSRKMAAIAKERSQAELTYLKAQLNPHFLFNSLNSLYAQLELDNGGAKRTLAAIADLLRYQLYECNAELIPLEKELAYLENYISLQRMRLDNCRVDWLSEGEPAGLLIAPLLLIPFVENAFKHVSDHPDGANRITIRLALSGRQLSFHCSNTINPECSGPKTHRGLGLANARQRLALIYGNDHLLEQETTDHRYNIRLTLNLSHAELSDR